VKKSKGKNLIGLFVILIVGIISFVVWFYLSNDEEVKEEIKKIDLELVRANYSDYVSLNDGSSLYVKENNKYKKVSDIVGNIEVSLDSDYEVLDEYFKLLDSEYYIKYNSFSKIEILSNIDGEYKYYNNYVVYNEDVVLNSGAKLYVDDSNYYVVDDGSFDVIESNFNSDKKV
jgi:hypothetical protein